MKLVQPRACKYINLRHSHIKVEP
eukprot:UN08678